MKKRPNSQSPLSASGSPASNPDDLLANIARQISVLVVKQHRYLLAKEERLKRKKEG